MVKSKTKNYELIFGSNLIHNCPGVINFAGKGINKQPIVFREGEDGKILLNCHVKDKQGNTVVKLHNSNPVHVNEEYDINIEDKQILVTNKSSKDIWLDFSEIEPNVFKINGIFFLPGYEIVATDEYLRINGSYYSYCESHSSLNAFGLG